MRPKLASDQREEQGVDSSAVIPATPSASRAPSNSRVLKSERMHGHLPSADERFIRTRRRLVARTSFAALALVLSLASVRVAAQVAPSDPGEIAQSPAGTAAPAEDAGASTPSAEGVIVVTGSRLGTQGGFQAPTPVTVVSTEQLQQAAPSSIGDALNQLPIFRNSAQPQSTGVTVAGTVGQSFLNLRSLGAQRTLILLDGRRLVPSTAAGATDISILPEQVVRRVDIVTGGASAAYGSDAVAGVVNFIIDTDFTGVRASLQAGVAEEGYGASQRVNLAGGVDLGDRGHFLLSGSFYNNEGVERFGDFSWYDSCARITNPAGSPQQIVACNVHSAAFTRGGIIPSGPLAGTEFGPGGVPQAFTYGSQRTQLSMVGGSGEDHGSSFPPIPAVRRYTAYGHLRYDLTDDIMISADALAAEATAHYVSTAPWQGQTSGYTIQVDNAFLPASVRQRMVAAGVRTVPLWRYNYDFGLLDANSRNRTLRGSIGLEATLGDWTADAYYSHGRNKYRVTTGNNPYVSRLYQAADAVIGPNGQPICRSTLTAPSDGCVPLNLFGEGSPSDQALSYVLGTSVSDQLVTQDVAEINMAGSPFSLWAGPVAIAFGGGYRRESSDQPVDPISPQTRRAPVPGEPGYYLGFPPALNGQLGGWERTNPQPLKGSFSLKEVFGEIGIPLARDLPFAYSADLNGAIRYTDYSLSGGVTTWKVGLTYEPIPDIRFRVTRSRDIRAANISELFTGALVGQGNLIDPTFPVGDPNRTPLTYVRSYGNPELVPERADTLTFGVVLQPRFFPGFSLSVDYYDIAIDQAIGTLGGQVTIDQCVAGATSLCSLLTRDPSGVLVSVDTPFLNISRRTTSGIDIEASYRTDVGPGALALRGLATYVETLKTFNPGANPIELAGQTGGGGGVPHWVANFDLNYEVGGFAIFAQERYIGPGALDKTLLAATLAPDSNRVESRFYTDLTLSQEIETSGQTVEVFFTVNNLFDEAPPLAPSFFFVFGASNGGTNPSLFDLIGRQYTVGVRGRF